MGKMSFKLSLLTIQGLVSRRTNKINSPELASIFDSSDIVLLTETWTNDFSDIDVRNFGHFVLSRKDVKAGSRRNSGGIIVYIRDKFVSKHTLILKSEDDLFMG